jgi:hypothetical protein
MSAYSWITATFVVLVMIIMTVRHMIKETIQ